MTLKTAFPTALLPILASACGPAPTDPQDVPDAGGAAAAEDALPPGTLAVPPAVRRNLGLTFAEVELREVARTLRVPGAFELSPRARREYHMALPGRVELLVDELDVVQEGQVLYRFQSPAWPELLHEILEGEQAMATARSQIAVARATADEAAARLEQLQTRLESLAAAEVRRADLEAEVVALEASLPRLRAEEDLARTHLANAERTREHALHRASTAAAIPEEELEAEVTVGGRTVPTYLTLDWIDVRADAAGVVEHLGVTDGAFVEPPSTVVSTADPGRVRFRALALQSDLERLTGIERARIVPPLAPGVSPAEGIEAALAFGLEAHSRERTLTLFGTPRGGAPWIRPGVSAFLEVVVEATPEPSLAIPRSALVQHGLQQVFFRRDPENPDRVRRVEADLGPSDGRWVAVRSGLMRGDQVVLEGIYELMLALEQEGASGPRSESHVHADGTVHGNH